MHKVKNFIKYRVNWQYLKCELIAWIKKKPILYKCAVNCYLAPYRTKNWYWHKKQQIQLYFNNIRNRNLPLSNKIPNFLKKIIKNIPWLYGLSLSIYQTINQLRNHFVKWYSEQFHNFKVWARKRPVLIKYIRLFRQRPKPFFPALGREIIYDLKYLKNFITLYKHHKILERIYYEAIDICIKNKVYGWWNHARVEFTNYADTYGSSIFLQHFLRDFVLRRAGDYKEFIRLTNKVGRILHELPNDIEFIKAIATHYEKTVKSIDENTLFSKSELTFEKQPIVIGVSVWGDFFTNMLTTYCLPSITTEGNLGTLCKHRTPILFIHTNEKSKAMIENSPVADKIKSMGCKILYRMLDEEILGRLGEDPNHKYWHLGMVQAIDIHFSKHIGADYHLMMPDIVYANAYFSGMINAVNRGNLAIFKVAYRTKLETVLTDVKRYEKEDGTIDIPCRDLVSMGMKHLHQASSFVFVTNKDLSKELPPIHVLVWQSEEAIHSLSPHQSIVYLDHTELQKVKQRFYITVDSEIDKIIPHDCPAYCPTAEDGIYVMEMSSEDDHALPTHTYKIDYYCQMFWANIESMAHWKFFEQEVVAPLNPDMLPKNRNVASLENIKEQQTFIRNALKKNFPKTTVDNALNGLTHIAHLFNANINKVEMHSRYQQAALTILDTCGDTIHLATQKEKKKLISLLNAIALSAEAEQYGERFDQERMTKLKKAA